MPDEFHDLQPQLLSATLRLNVPPDQYFTGTDLNLYYDVWHPLWHKRPDWFLVVGVPRLYEGRDLRSSYVIWQEGITPFVVVELLSPGTEKEDLGSFVDTETPTTATPAAPDRATAANGHDTPATPPRKWEVYERILRVPYYLVYSRYTNQLRGFQLVGGRYQEQPLNATNPRIWIPELKLGLSLWEGTYDRTLRQWLHWCDAGGNWVPTPEEQAAQEQQRADRLAERLRQLGVNDDV